MFDAAELAVPEVAEKVVAGKPFDGNLKDRIAGVIKAGASIGVCKPCLMQRKLLGTKLIEGIQVITGIDLLESTYVAAKVILMRKLFRTASANKPACFLATIIHF